jgi:uncharacterized membrane protein YphA (DoxX/SURF4 family)
MIMKCYEFLGVLVTPVAALLTRIAVGLGFYRAGVGKTGRLDQIAEWFASLGIPAPVLNAYVVSYLEMIGGLLLVVGVGTRPVATLLLGTMTVAMVTADRTAVLGAIGFQRHAGPDDTTVIGPWSFAELLRPDTALLDVAPVVFALLLLWLIARGPGVLSIDGLVRRWHGGEPAAAKPAKKSPQRPKE